MHPPEELRVVTSRLHSVSQKLVSLQDVARGPPPTAQPGPTHLTHLSKYMYIGPRTQGTEVMGGDVVTPRGALWKRKKREKKERKAFVTAFKVRKALDMFELGARVTSTHTSSTLRVYASSSAGLRCMLVHLSVYWSVHVDVNQTISCNRFFLFARDRITLRPGSCRDELRHVCPSPDQADERPPLSFRKAHNERHA